MEGYLFWHFGHIWPSWTLLSTVDPFLVTLAIFLAILGHLSLLWPYFVAFIGDDWPLVGCFCPFWLLLVGGMQSLYFCWSKAAKKQPRCKGMQGDAEPKGWVTISACIGLSQRCHKWGYVTIWAVFWHFCHFMDNCGHSWSFGALFAFFWSFLTIRLAILGQLKQLLAISHNSANLHSF